ncbi:MAG: EAL domain-containing protein [Pseudomonadota bacterium]
MAASAQDELATFQRSVAAGGEIFSEGADGDCAYIIRRGRVEIFTGSGAGRRVLAERGPTEVFGEMAIVDRKPRSASARALTDCDLLIFTDGQLQRRLATLDPVLRMIVSVILERFRESVGHAHAAAAPADAGAMKAAPAGDGDGEHHAAIAQIELEQDIRRGLENDEFVLFYQPIVAAATERTAGFEALARWRHPIHGLLGPHRFIPCAEETGLIRSISEWAVRSACRDAVRFAPGATGAPPFVTVNLSTQEICDPSFTRIVHEALSTAGLAPERLKIEITETNIMENPELAIEMMEKYRDIGINLSIDDFGSGYSNLNYLSQYPVQVLKIDKTFIDRIGERKGDDLVLTMIKIGQIMGMTVVAEGVETSEQAAALVEQGCDHLQGFRFARPMPLEDALDYLARETTAAG